MNPPRRLSAGGLSPDRFEAAETRRIRPRAGFTNLDRDGARFLRLSGTPDGLFHTGMALRFPRCQRTGIGKADFDGQHDYPHGFRF